MDNQFNLVDEPWIPIINKGLVSLKDIFSNPQYQVLGGNPIQKIALIKLLLAIAQAAYTPVDNYDWEKLNIDGLANRSLEYLNKLHNRFWLYGDNPFLQMPVILEYFKKNNIQPKEIGYGFYPDLPCDNNSILTQSQISQDLNDSEKALFLVTLMNFAFGGKRIEKSAPSLTVNYVGKTSSAKAGPSLGNFEGYLHTFLTGATLLETLWLNLLTLEKIKQNAQWTFGLGVPPWEKMPQGEACETAIQLKNSYMGCLVAMSRFVLLNAKGIYYLEGIQYPSHKNGWREPSMAINEKGKNTRTLWVDPNKRPWRELTALLSFIGNNNDASFECPLLRWGLPRVKENQKLGIWSGGLKVRATAGDQSIKQDDDFVESHIFLEANIGEKWFEQLEFEMNILNSISKNIYKATCNYYKSQKKEGKDQAILANRLFWQLCERQFQALVNSCDSDTFVIIRKQLIGYAYKSYDYYCPKNTARQLDAWSKNYPHLTQYLEGTHE